MLRTSPRTRNLSVAAPRVSLGLPPKSKRAPEPEPEPAPTPGPDPEPAPTPEVESESPQRREVDAINAHLRQMLSQMQDDAERNKVVSGWLDDLIVVVEHNVEREAARAYRDSLEIKNVVNNLIERVEGEVADQAAQRAHFASQLAAEMADECVREAAADVARDVFVTVQVPTVVRRDVGAWSHTQPPGTAIVRGYDNVDVCVNAQDVARACGLNVHAPVFIPTNSPFSSLPYYI